ncbi:TPA: radical SAM protein [Candidatus Sumerlaeota bacterium]|jgi:anaerobic magnesium-protoporphyrin IX monomethyl ester cyclase|nr:radical SAM protein [Candidatus Sumerlaeota bacterium]
MISPLPPSTLRVLFLNPPDLQGGLWMKEVGRCGRKSIGGEIWPQTGLAYLAAMAERARAEVFLLDGMVDSLSLEDLVEKARKVWRPHLIIANSATPTLRNDAVILERLREATDALCGFAGPHVSALPEETLRDTSADFGLINEAEDTVAEMVRALSEGNEISSIPGIVYRNMHTGEIVVNPPRPLIHELDSLPLPARHLLPNDKYRMPFFADHPFATLIPNRGCPWPCTFCRAGRVWGKKVRQRSVANVMAEIKELGERYGIHHLAFMTDSLTLKKDWAQDLFENLLALPQPIEWVCNSRVDAVDPDLLRLMRQAGCKMISYGLESGSQVVLDACKKGISLEQSERAIRLTREAGIPSMGYFILGLPGETRQTVQESIAFAKRIAPDYVNFHIATPFPGTELFEQAVANNWLTSTDWNDFEEEGAAVMQVGELTIPELESLQKQAMRAFYMRPSKIFQELARLRSWPDFKAKAKAGLRMLATLGGKKKNKI